MIERFEKYEEELIQKRYKLRNEKIELNTQLKINEAKSIQLEGIIDDVKEIVTEYKTEK